MFWLVFESQEKASFFFVVSEFRESKTVGCWAKMRESCRVLGDIRRGIKLAGSVGVCFWDPIVRGFWFLSAA